MLTGQGATRHKSDNSRAKSGSVDWENGVLVIKVTTCSHARGSLAAASFGSSVASALLAASVIWPSSSAIRESRSVL